MKAMFFPYYGSQFVGMGKELYDTQRLMQEYFEEAAICLSMNFVKLCFASSEAELAQLHNAYTSLFLMGASSAGLVREAGTKIDFVAAFDIVGWYSALFAARSISLPDGLYILNKYAQIYDEFIKSGLYAGIWVHVHADRVKEFFIEEGGPDLALAQIWPEKTALVGSVESIQKLEQFLQQESIRFEAYDLGLGLHAPLGASFVAPLHDYLEKIDIKVPEIPVLSPLDGKQIMTDTQLQGIAKTIFTQPLLIDTMIDRSQATEEFLIAIPAQKIKISLEKIFVEKHFEHTKLITMETKAEFDAILPVQDTDLSKEDHGEQS